MSEPADIQNQVYTLICLGMDVLRRVPVRTNHVWQAVERRVLYDSSSWLETRHLMRLAVSMELDDVGGSSQTQSTETI